MGSSLAISMLLKHSILATLLYTASAKRKGGRRHFKRHQAYLAEKGGHSTVQFNMPGSQELFESFMNKEVEGNYMLRDLDEEYDNEQEMILATVGDRNWQHRPNTHKPNGKPWPISDNLPLPESLTIIENAGGIPFCKALAKITPENLPKFVLNNPHVGNGYLSTYPTYIMLTTQCEDLYKLMRRRRAACTKSLLEIYNPRRKWQLRPHHKARLKYCRKIVKLRNPYIWCKKRCPNGDHGNFCRKKKENCTCRLNKWLANNRALVGGDRSNVGCNKLPKGVSEMPGEGSPLNEALRCGKRVCDWIPGSELPWCPVGDATARASFQNSNYAKGNEYYDGWTDGSGSCDNFNGPAPPNK